MEISFYSYLARCSQQNFEFRMWKIVAIWWPVIELQQGKISIELKLKQYTFNSEIGCFLANVLSPDTGLGHQQAHTKCKIKLCFLLLDISNTLWLIRWSSFKMADEIPWNITALWVLNHVLTLWSYICKVWIVHWANFISAGPRQWKQSCYVASMWLLLLS